MKLERILTSYKLLSKTLILSTMFQLFLFLLLVNSRVSVNAQIVYPDEKVKINMCCELNLSAGTSCRTGGSIKSGSIVEPSESNIRAESQIRTTEWTFPAHLMSNNRSTTFLLVNNRPVCTAGVSTHKFNTTDKTSFQFLVEADGFVGIGPEKLNLAYYNVNQYCLNGIDRKFIEIHTCVAPCTNEEPCIHKCCPLNKIFSPFHPNPPDKRCEDVGAIKWSPTYYRRPKDPKSELSQADIVKKNAFYFARHPATFQHKCPHSQTISITSSQNVAAADLGIEYLSYRMSENGKVWHRDETRNWATVGQVMCIDGIQNYMDDPIPGAESESVIFVCPLHQEEERQVNLYYGTFSIVCSIFALLTVLVYALLWEKQTVHGWTIMSYSTVVFFLFIFLGIAHLTLLYNEELMNTAGCKIIATISHFLFIAMFSWLTMISLDLWLTFRTIMVASGRSQGLKRYLTYSAMGWGIPLFMIVLSWSLELKYADDENTEVKVPLYGTKVCYVLSLFLWEFVYGTCAILFGFNIVFFVLTTWKLIAYKRSTRLATKSSQNRQSYLLFVKLFFIVGILWIFEIISWASSGVHIAIGWQIFDTLNCLQPVAIFFIFVFKYDMINSLGEKYSCMKPCLVPILKLLSLCERKKKHQIKPTVDEQSSAHNMSKTNYTHVSKSDDMESENTKI